MRRDDGGLSAFALRVERAWTELQGRAIVLAPRDWDLIEDWHARGIPARVVEEAIGEARHRLRGVPRPPSRLAYVAPAVEESWAATVDGRRAGESPAPAASTDWRTAWEARLRSHADRSLANALRGLLRAATTEGAFVGAAAERLGPTLPPSVRDGIERAVGERLRVLRERIGREELERQAERLRDRRIVEAALPATGPRNR